MRYYKILWIVIMIPVRSPFGVSVLSKQITITVDIKLGFYKLLVNNSIYNQRC